MRAERQKGGSAALRAGGGAGLREEAESSSDGQADDVEIAALDARDPAGGVALDAVGAGFVEGLAAGEIVDQFGLLDDIEGDLGDFDVGERLGRGEDGDTGHDGVGAAGEEVEHASGVSLVGGLAENLAVGHDAGVGGEDDQRVAFAGDAFAAGCGQGLGLLDRAQAEDGALGGAGSSLDVGSRRRCSGGVLAAQPGPDSEGLGFGQAQDIGSGVFARVNRLGEIGGFDGEVQAGLREKFTATG